jgi:signal transduction histidine kinase
LGAASAFGMRAAIAGGGRVDILLDEAYLAAVIGAIDSRAEAHVTLVDSDMRPLIAVDDAGWLPASSFTLDGEAGVVASSLDGKSRRYGVAPIAGPHAYVLTSLDAAASGAWRSRYPLALLLPALALVLISYIFLRTLKTGVVDWVVGLDAVARRSRADPAVRARIAPTMPSEIETVSRSFNEVLDARDARERELSEALAHNRALTRELHHRVKNSLQLVQSYLALAAREAREPARESLLAAQCRAYILSAAYRRALAEGEMRAIEIDAFLGDVAAYAANLLRGPGQTVTRTFETEAFAGIDEAIPLGMIVVELVDSGLRELGARDMHVVASAIGGGAGMIFAGADGARPFPVASRLLVGLMRQVGATPAEPPPGSQVCLRFEMPRPPEHFRLVDTTHAETPASPSQPASG